MIQGSKRNYKSNFSVKRVRIHHLVVCSFMMKHNKFGRELQRTIDKKGNDFHFRVQTLKQTEKFPSENHYFVHLDFKKQEKKSCTTYSVDMNCSNRALTRSNPCLTRRRFRVWLPGVFTVSFAISASSIVCNVSFFLEASTRSRT